MAIGFEIQKRFYAIERQYIGTEIGLEPVPTTASEKKYNKNINETTNKLIQEGRILKNGKVKKVNLDEFEPSHSTEILCPDNTIDLLETWEIKTEVIAIYENYFYIKGVNVPAMYPFDRFHWLVTSSLERRLALATLHKIGVVSILDFEKRETEDSVQHYTLILAEEKKLKKFHSLLFDNDVVHPQSRQKILEACATLWKKPIEVLRFCERNDIELSFPGLAKDVHECIAALIDKYNHKKTPENKMEELLEYIANEYKFTSKEKYTKVQKEFSQILKINNLNNKTPAESNRIDVVTENKSGVLVTKVSYGGKTSNAITGVAAEILQVLYNSSSKEAALTAREIEQRITGTNCHKTIRITINRLNKKMEWNMNCKPVKVITHEHPTRKQYCNGNI